MEVTKGLDGRWYKPCSQCNSMQSYLRRNYAYESLKLNKLCKKCSNRDTDNSHRGWYRGIRVSWFNQFKASSLLRNLSFEINIDDVADLYENQKGRCNLTGWSIVFPEIGHPQISTASIDRIDSSKGYIKNNIQLVHKDVNMAKQRYSQEYFIEMCKAVAKTW